MKKKKILIIAHNFWPENFPINYISKLLANEFSIEVLTGYPNYPKGKFFKNYNYLIPKREVYDNILINRVPILPRFKGRSFQLALNYLSFIFSACLFGFFMTFKKKYDLVLVYAPSPLLQSLVGIFFAKIKRVKIITWVQDLWPDVLKSTGHIRNSHIIAFINYIVNFIYKKNDLLLAQSFSFKKIIESYSEDYKVNFLPNPGNPLYFNINNEIIMDDYHVLIEKISNSFSIVYAGNIGTAQSIETIINASKFVINNSKIKIFIIGTGKSLKFLKSYTKQNNLNNIYFCDFIDEVFLPKILSYSKILYISMKDDAMLNSTIPSKFQNYLALGKPILASISGETSNIIKKNNLGFVCKPDNSKALGETIVKIFNLTEGDLSNISNNCKNFFLENYHPNHVINDLKNNINIIIDEKKI
jgi:glycosyltransferase involved in cell wall biosynthesis